MNKIKHAAAKKVFAGVMDYAVDQVNKNPTFAVTPFPLSSSISVTRSL